MKKSTYILVSLFIFSMAAHASMKVKIIEVKGDVNVRRGVEESWQPAKKGMLLEEIDTIQSGEEAKVTIEIEQVGTFTLDGNAILDIADLRKISEKELFLFLMSKKTREIEPRNDKKKLRVGNVSVIHGEKKEDKGNRIDSTIIISTTEKWIPEVNAAEALYRQQFYTNTIVKLVKIFTNYSDIHDCGKIHYYLGKSFEAINNSGQAVEAYQNMINRFEEQGCENDDAKRWINEAQQAIDKLTK